ncbi:MAG: PorT family protein [Bacteroidales bacterium]|nr:PorT family protein [Bacteroidales bacterium]
MKSGKKILVALIMAVAMSFLAKTASSQLFWIGGNGGIQVSWFTSPGVDNAVLSAGAGYNLGFFLRYGKKPFYQVDFRWIRANNLISYEYEPGEFIEGEVPFHKFEIPVRIGYPVYYSPMFKWHVNGGPVFSTVFLFSENNFEFERDDMRNPQFGVMAGTGIQFMNFIVDLDYSYHLTELFKGDEEDLGVDFKSHLQLISLKVGFQF